MTWTRWIRSGAFALALAAALGTGGCLQTDSKTTVLADGSGQVSETSSFDIEKLKSLVEMAKMMQGGGAPGGAPGGPQVPEMDVEKMLEAGFGEEALKKQLKETPGVEPKTVKSEVKDGKRVVTMEYAFADFASLGAVGYGFAGAELKKNDDGSWTLQYDASNGMGGILGGGAGGPGAGQPEGMPAGMDMGAMMAMLEPYVGTLETKRSVTVPGTIVDTNGTKSEDGKTVSWSFGFKDMTSPPKDGKPAGRQYVTFKGEGLTLKPFQYKPDPGQMMKRMNKPAEKPAGGAAPTPEKPAGEGK